MDKTRRSDVTLPAVEQRKEALWIGDNNHLQRDTEVFGKGLEQFVFVASRFALIDEIGGGIVRSENNEVAALANLRQVTIDRLDQRKVRTPINSINGLERRRLTLTRRRQGNKQAEENKRD